jgi:hypothetical protein
VYAVIAVAYIAVQVAKRHDPVVSVTVENQQEILFPQTIRLCPENRNPIAWQAFWYYYPEGLSAAANIIHPEGSAVDCAQVYIKGFVSAQKLPVSLLFNIAYLQSGELVNNQYFSTASTLFAGSIDEAMNKGFQAETMAKVDASFYGSTFTDTNSVLLFQSNYTDISNNQFTTWKPVVGKIRTFQPVPDFAVPLVCGQSLSNSACNSDGVAFLKTYSSNCVSSSTYCLYVLSIELQINSKSAEIYTELDPVQPLAMIGTIGGYTMFISLAFAICFVEKDIDWMVARFPKLFKKKKQVDDSVQELEEQATE